MPKISTSGRSGRWLMSRTALSKVRCPSSAFAFVQRCEIKKTPTGKTPDSEWSRRSQNPRRDGSRRGNRELGTCASRVIGEPPDHVKKAVLSQSCGDGGGRVRGGRRVWRA